LKFNPANPENMRPEGEILAKNINTEHAEFHGKTGPFRRLL
jgi:hypothetical protein